MEDAGFEGEEVEAPSLDTSSLRSLAEATEGSFFEIKNEEFFQESLKEILLQRETVGLDSNYYVLIFISILIITEITLYSKFGAI